MEFLKIIKRRSFLHEVVYIILNVVLALSAMVLIRVTGVYWPSLVLVLVSKWRILAVRPRFWLANIQANLVSIIVSVSYVIFLYLAQSLDSLTYNQTLIVHIILTSFYILWLLFIKPKSKRIFIVLQAAIALIGGVTAVFATIYSWPVIFTVALTLLIAYSSTKHILGSYDEEKHIRLISLFVSFVMAEISWLSYHWLIAYNLPFMSGILIPQATIIISCLAFLFYKSYDSFYKNQFIKINDIILPLIFTISLTAVLILFFNDIYVNNF